MFTVKLTVKYFASKINKSIKRCTYIVVYRGCIRLWEPRKHALINVTSEIIIILLIIPAWSCRCVSIREARAHLSHLRWLKPSWLQSHIQVGVTKSQVRCIKTSTRTQVHTKQAHLPDSIWKFPKEPVREGRKTPQMCLERWGGLCSIMRDRYSWWTGLDWSLWATTRNKPEDALTCSASSDDISALSLLLLRSETLTHTPPIFTRRDRWRDTEVVWWWTRSGAARVGPCATQVGLWKGEAVARWTLYPAIRTEEKGLHLEHRQDRCFCGRGAEKMHERLRMLQWSDR